MHSRPVVVAFVFAIVLALGSPFAVGPTPPAVAQDATPAVASPVRGERRLRRSGRYRRWSSSVPGVPRYGQPHRHSRGRLPRLGPLLERRSAPPGGAADDGPARRGGVHPRLRLRPPGDLRQHRRGRLRQPQRPHRPAPHRPGGRRRSARPAAGGGGPRPLCPGGPLPGWPLRATLRQHLPRRGRRSGSR